MISEDDSNPATDDEHLRLVLLCCHPALDRDTQVALTLRLVGGLTTPEIASAFFVPEATLAQRIVRAKRKIRDAGMPLSMPANLDERVDALLGVLYLIFNEGYLTRGDAMASFGSISSTRRFASRARGAAAAGTARSRRTVGARNVQPGPPRTRTNHAGDLVLLEQQDRSHWDLATIEQANAVLARAMMRMAPGPYQMQAVIAGHHANARTAADTDWPMIAGSTANSCR